MWQQIIISSLPWLLPNYKSSWIDGKYPRRYPHIPSFSYPLLGLFSCLSFWLLDHLTSQFQQTSPFTKNKTKNMTLVRSVISAGGYGNFFKIRVTLKFDFQVYNLEIVPVLHMDSRVSSQIPTGLCPHLFKALHSPAMASIKPPCPLIHGQHLSHLWNDRA